ncbi:hypothetical protein NL676_007792 [Syzygium grande]|nr:hypothetical protein NL676_007792 [Syzygium grande]
MRYRGSRGMGIPAAGTVRRSSMVAPAGEGRESYEGRKEGRWVGVKIHAFIASPLIPRTRIRGVFVYLFLGLIGGVRESTVAVDLTRRACQVATSNGNLEVEIEVGGERGVDNEYR